MSLNSDEQGYLDLLKKILDVGSSRDDRTGTGTISLFGPQLSFDLRNSVIPVLTTKKIAIRIIIEELLWFIKGSTDGKELEDKKVFIWKANGTREYLDKIGLHDRNENDLGPIYGFQWRHAGADYTNCNADYSGKGIDQLAEVIDKIKNKPYDRRMLVVSWNVKDIPIMALPPCHCLFQFYVADGYLSCKLYQRSADMGLGVPFNITSYSLLVHMIAHVCKLKPREFIHSFGDVHIYNNHVEQLKEQINRKPYSFPKIKFAREVESIDDFKTDDFIIEGYNAHPRIIMELSA